MAPNPDPKTDPFSGVSVDPAKVEEVTRRTKEIIAAGEAPEAIFIGGSPTTLLTLNAGPGNKPIMLLFTSPFAVTDYVRFHKLEGIGVGQIKLEALPQAAQGWRAQVDRFALNRCPRCPRVSHSPIDVLSSREHFVAIWAADRAAKGLCSEMLVRSAFKNIQAQSWAQARADLEQIRDHFNCGIPYLHQMIALLAGTQQDTAVKDFSIERLKEFGPEFVAGAEFSLDSLSVAMVGLMGNFGLLPKDPPKDR